jgi:hypothetical protein
LRVDAQALRRVPAGDLAPVDQRDGKALTAAKDALAKATFELEEARRVTREAVADHAPAAATQKAKAALDAAKKGGEQVAIDQAQLEFTIAEEGEKLQAGKLAWMRAQEEWRERFCDAARMRVVAADAKLELARAELAAARAPGDEPIDVAPFRGQLGRAHEQWTASTTKVAAAHTAVDARAADLASEKARYAQLRKVVLPPPLIATDAAPPAPAAKSTR